jgi:DNA primase
MESKYIFLINKYGEENMAKISPVSIKYMIRASFVAEGALEKPDVIGALFGQTEGLLGADLEMRELQKEGKIGRIEVDLRRDGKRTVGNIQIPTALDQSETTLIAAAIETIERMGPTEAQIEVEKIEDVRGTKRDYIIERAKKLMQSIEGSSDSREISNTIKDSAKMSELQEYGKEKLPAGDLSGKEVIVVEGRADVLNLLKNNVKNVIGMNGTKLPDAIKELSETKEIILFVDGDRGGKLIAKNVNDNAKVAAVAVAPDGKEVEELTGKEILMALRKKVSVSAFLSFGNRLKRFERRERGYEKRESKREYVKENKVEEASELKKEVPKENSNKDTKSKLKEIFESNQGSGKAIMLDEDLKEIRKISAKAISSSLKRTKDRPFAVVIDGTATGSVLSNAEIAEVRVLVASNFATTDTKIELLSF